MDITSPPDPVSNGSTSDVPIHGEKTNILFHPTPSVSHEPMFLALEKKTGALCVGLLLSIVIVGKMLGGSLLGLLPLGAILATVVWMWMKEVVRSGRESDWDSEKVRGQTVNRPCSQNKYVCSTKTLFRPPQICFRNPWSG